MSLPVEALTIKIDPDQLTVDDMILFEAGGFKFSSFKSFLASHSNWSSEQIGALTMSEAKEVVKEIATQIAQGAIPKENAAS